MRENEDKITYENMVSKLVELFPELRLTYDEYRDWWGSDIQPTHLTYGIVFNPYLDSLLRSNEDVEALKRVFSFLEGLANQDDEKVQEVLVATILEHLNAHKQALSIARKYMGEKTRELADDVESAWG